MNAKGMSLAGVMVAGAILSGLALGMAKLMQNSFEGQREIESKDDLRSVVQIISGNLANSNACVNTFAFINDSTQLTQAQSSSGLAFTQILNKDGTVLYDINNSSSNTFGKVTLTGFRIRNLNMSSNSAELLVQANYKKNAVMSLDRDRMLGLSIAVDASNSVSVCSSIGVDDGLWEKMTPPALGILYSAGSVMVGTGNVNSESPVPAFGVGSNNTILAPNAVGLGANNETDSDSNFAMLFGRDNRVMNANSTNSVLIGSENLVTKANAVAIGHQNDATGFRSFAIGSFNIASNDGSTAIGTVVASSGVGSTGLGVDITSSGDFSTAIGYDSVATGARAIALGTAAKATGANSVALSGGTASGANSLAYKGTASGSSAMAIGNSTESSGNFSTAIGNNVRASGNNSMVLGRNSKVTVDNAMVLNASNLNLNPIATVGRTNGVDVYAPTGLNVCKDANCHRHYSLYIEESGSPVPGLSFWANGGTGSQGNLNFWIMGGGKKVRICTGMVCGSGIETDGGPSLWTTISDRNQKKDFSLLDKEEVLNRMDLLEIFTWRYKNEKESDKLHIGPMAQDFYRLFIAPYGLEGEEKRISPTQVFYMNVLATQALHQKVKTLEKENGELKQELAIMKNELGMLRQAVCELSPRSEVCQN